MVAMFYCFGEHVKPIYLGTVTRVKSSVHDLGIYLPDGWSSVLLRKSIRVLDCMGISGKKADEIVQQEL